MKSMSLSELVAKVRMQKPNVSVGAIRYQIRSLGLGYQDENRYRFFDDTDVAVVVEHVVEEAMPHYTSTEKRIERLPELSTLKDVAAAIEMEYEDLDRLVMNGLCAVAFIGNEFYMTREMVRWVYRYSDGPKTARHRNWIHEHNEYFNTVADWKKKHRINY